MKSPKTLDVSKYDAQKAQGYSTGSSGYEISPLFWERVKYGLSAGRVQSVALKLVCEREDEIEAFVKEEYWTIEADFLLERRNGESQVGAHRRPEGEDSVRKKRPTGSGAMEGKASRLKEWRRRKGYVSPYPAFKTSSLQQDASSKLKFSPKKTMLLAQKLFEGVEIGKNTRPASSLI